jgi:hypothetical protein
MQQRRAARAQEKRFAYGRTVPARSAHFRRRLFMLSTQVPRAHPHARDLLRSSLADMRERIEEKRRGQPGAAELVPVEKVVGARPKTGGGAFDAVVHASPQVTLRLPIETPKFTPYHF